MATSYILQSLPSLKILLHLAKHPHSTVIGFLVGVLEGDRVTVSDAIPFVHHWLDLSPMLEAGLALAKIHVGSNKLKLVGTYIAHSRADLNCLDLVSRKLNKSLEFDGSILIVIDNQKLNTSENPFIPFTQSTEEEYTLLEADRFEAQIPQNWLDSGGSIGDFDDHLEDVGVDWLVNPTVVSLTNTGKQLSL